MTSRFDIKLLQSQIKEKNGFGSNIKHFHSIESTQTYLEENINNFPSGVIAVADIQTEGRGRGSNNWVSVTSALQFSFIIKISNANANRISLFQYYVSLIMLESITKIKASVSKSIFIKWPNDIVIWNSSSRKYVKIGGILVTSSSLGPDITLVIGVGLNLSKEDNDLYSSNNTGLGLTFASSSWGVLSDCEGYFYPDHNTSLLSREILLAEFCNQFAVSIKRFSADFSFFSNMYLSRWIHSNQIVIINEKDPICIKGIDASGLLTAYKLGPLSYLLCKALTFRNYLPISCWAFDSFFRFISDKLLIPIYIYSLRLFFNIDEVILEPNLYSLDISSSTIRSKLIK